MSRYPIYRNLSLESDGVSKVNSASIGEITVVPQDYPCLSTIIGKRSFL